MTEKQKKTQKQKQVSLKKTHILFYFVKKIEVRSSQILLMRPTTTTMPYTEIDSSNIAVRGKCACDEDMVVFDYDGISYVYYTSIMDTYYGMVEEHDITLNPYLRDEGEMQNRHHWEMGFRKKHCGFRRKVAKSRPPPSVQRNAILPSAHGPHLPAGHHSGVSELGQLALAEAGRRESVG